MTVVFSHQQGGEITDAALPWCKSWRCWKSVRSELLQGLGAMRMLLWKACRHNSHSVLAEADAAAMGLLAERK
jgi:hypothetical protein